MACARDWHTATVGGLGGGGGGAAVVEGLSQRGRRVEFDGVFGGGGG